MWFGTSSRCMLRCSISGWWDGLVGWSFHLVPRGQSQSSFRKQKTKSKNKNAHLYTVLMHDMRWILSTAHCFIHLNIRFKKSKKTVSRLLIRTQCISIMKPKCKFFIKKIKIHIPFGCTIVFLSYSLSFRPQSIKIIFSFPFPRTTTHHPMSSCVFRRRRPPDRPMEKG